MVVLVVKVFCLGIRRPPRACGRSRRWSARREIPALPTVRRRSAVWLPALVVLVEQRICVRLLQCGVPRYLR